MRISDWSSDVCSSDLEFLRWTAEDHFTLFGYREYEVKKKGKEEILCAVEGSGLGLLRAKAAGKPRLLKSLAAHYMPQSGAADALILTMTKAPSKVHRPGLLSYIGLHQLDAISEARRVGKECVRPCRSWWRTSHSTIK